MGAAAQTYFNEIKKYRSDAKKNILLARLVSKVKEELRPRLTKNVDYDRECECAIPAESVVINSIDKFNRRRNVSMQPSRGFKQKEKGMLLKQKT